MTVDKNYIVDIASEFSTTDSDRIDRLVALATLQVPASAWGDVQELAIAYLVAHWLKVDSLKGKGAVTSEELGDVKRTFAATSRAGKDADGYSQTSYGSQFLILRKTRLAGPLVT